MCNVHPKNQPISDTSDTDPIYRHSSNYNNNPFILIPVRNIILFFQWILVIQLDMTYNAILSKKYSDELINTYEGFISRSTLFFSSKM